MSSKKCWCNRYENVESNILLWRMEKSSFLTIQLLSRFSFGHWTSKPGNFNHPTLKPLTIGYHMILMGGFKFFYLQFSP
jgi:DNA modification methylase